jgi:hypothetical protein
MLTRSESTCYVKIQNFHSEFVTPCFPQIVNITELAKDYGKTHKYEYVM